MITIVGVFASRAFGERAVRALTEAGFREDRITLLTPGLSEAAIDAVPTTDAEPPGIGRAIGGVVGGAAGASGAMALVALTVPGVGPVMVLGAIGAALLGLVGAAVGDTLDRSLREGLPRDELYIYEDALRHGRTLVIAMTDDEEQAARGRGTLAEMRAETIDAAREQWWVGLRDAEAAEYTASGGDFARDEATFRRGFESSFAAGLEDRAYPEVIDRLRARCPDVYAEDAFRRGYERGRAYRQARRENRRAA